MKDDDRTVDRLLDVLAEAQELVSAFAEDTYKSKKAEEALRESEERYRLHFSRANDIMFSFNQQLVFLSVSPNVERVLGYKPEELIGRPFAETNLLHPDDIHEAVENAQHVLAGGVTLASIFQFVSKEGEILFGEVSGIPLTREGRVVEVINVARDITKRIQMENSLRENAESNQNILQCMPNALCLLKIDDARFVYANDPFCRLSGYSLTEILGKTPVELKLPVSLEDFDYCIDAVKNAGSVNNLKNRLRKKDGAIRDTLVSAGSIRHGGEECIVMVITDVTRPL
jgi:two-component system, NarL family, sensor histidine kinase ComP